MNTEPPEGDELQRMLVAMKQHVLERATPRPARRRGRPGIVVGVVALLALGTATGAVALTLSQQDRPTAAPAQTQQPEPTPSATTPGSAPITGRPTARPTAAPAAVASIPTDCRSVVPASDQARLFGSEEPVQVPNSEPESDPGHVTTALYCLWGTNSGSAGLSLTIGTHTPEQADVASSDFFGDLHPSCTDEAGGTVCRATFVPEDGGTQTRTRYVRDGTWIEVDQRNFPTSGLLPAIVGEVWGD